MPLFGGCSPPRICRTCSKFRSAPPLNFCGCRRGRGAPSFQPSKAAESSGRTRTARRNSGSPHLTFAQAPLSFRKRPGRGGGRWATWSCWLPAPERLSSGPFFQLPQGDVRGLRVSHFPLRRQMWKGHSRDTMECPGGAQHRGFPPPGRTGSAASVRDGKLSLQEGKVSRLLSASNREVSLWKNNNNPESIWETTNNPPPPESERRARATGLTSTLKYCSALHPVAHKIQSKACKKNTLE